jgi:hypothetical protein
MSTTIINEGDFKTLNLDANSIEMLEDAYQAVTKANRWAFLKRPDVPPKDKGFMFSDAAELNDINTHMEYGGHSGASYAWTMRTMEFIAKKGWDAYVESVKENQRKEEEEERKRKERIYNYRAVNDVENHPIYLARETTPIQNLLTTATVIDQAINRAAQQGISDPLSFAQSLQANPEVRKQIPDIDSQVNAIQKFSEGKMSYAEMRSLCG